jgi:hypothetical protein
VEEARWVTCEHAESLARLLNAWPFNRNGLLGRQVDAPPPLRFCKWAGPHLSFVLEPGRKGWWKLGGSQLEG